MHSMMQVAISNLFSIPANTGYTKCIVCGMRFKANKVKPSTTMCSDHCREQYQMTRRKRRE